MKLDHCYLGDCRDSMRHMLSQGWGGKVQTIVTSPPYFGLRDYGVDGQLGLEDSPQEFIANMVGVFDLCRELLADDGTCWINMGDSYANDGKWGGHTGGKHVKALHASPIGRNKRYTGLKPKELCGIPWRLAFALQDAGWYLRQDIIWSKPNPMPESVRDRCTKAHEYLFLLTKAPRYYFDQEAISEPVAESTISRLSQPTLEKQQGSGRVPGKTNGPMKAKPPRFGGEKYGGNDSPENQTKSGNEYTGSANGKRNKRSVWTIPTESYSEAHFATFPRALVEPCILAGSRPGDIVFDPFLGSGTTAQVAQQLGRRWIGCELNREYVKLQAARTRQQGLVLA